VRIAEAALELLAREGARGLTHRAVDHELKLPAGSTSYYFSTRATLLLAAAERLVELDMIDIAATPDGIDGAVALVERWLSPARRTRSLARMELLLTSARDPAFGLMRRARQSFVDRAHRGKTPAAARTATMTLVALADGLILHGLVSGGLRRGEVRLALERIRSRPREQTPEPRAKTPPKRKLGK
jgi:DNA-binding transcriptional regulator YbjK